MSSKEAVKDMIQVSDAIGTVSISDSAGTVDSDGKNFRNIVSTCSILEKIILSTYLGTLPLY